jgi:hypothetical protein
MPRRIMDLTLADIRGADAVVSRYGRWLSFHDAEILQVHLQRGGRSSVTLRVVDPVAPDQRVRFVFEGIRDLTLDGEDVDRQNVIASLTVEKAAGATTLIFSPCYGLAGHITAEHVSVELE